MQKTSWNYIYQQKHFFAQVGDGLGDLAEKELKSLGAYACRQVYRGIHFDADLKDVYRINYCSRFITRVLAPLVRFDCKDPDTLYKRALQISWEEFFTVDHTFAAFATVAHSTMTHSHYAALKLKDAIVDSFRAKTEKRPSVSTDNPDVWINLHIDNNQAVISIDLSGGSLHRRGYRTAINEAPMQELLAAAIIEHTGWDGVQPLYDPFCGTGTLLGEALIYATHLPANFLRSRFGFEYLPEFSRSDWEAVKSSAQKNRVPLPVGLIGGSDISKFSIDAAIHNCAMLPDGENIDMVACDFKEIEALDNTIIVCNPPYGKRMCSQEETIKLYGEFGDFLKKRCRGSTAYIYCGIKELVVAIGLKPAWKKVLPNGPLDGRLVKIEVY